ncbi:expressed unknown protein [Seminavis robusta]|uniref:Uncharacterized protein n=1 Tax=Seminavis robusta TaxID=568900 RepID=A0A9N8DPW6_9STRA|nr:expressed unknown protein [Seminavis robusta]|eukprot:Sro286_g108380.1 n/a (453) ;mRNA; f:60998-62356
MILGASPVSLDATSADAGTTSDCTGSHDRYVKSLDQEDTMNRSPCGHHADLVEPLRIVSSDKVAMKSFDVVSSEPDVELKRRKDDGPELSKASEDEDELVLDGSDLMEQSIREVHVLQSRIRLIRQQSLDTGSCVKEDECQTISWFRHTNAERSSQRRRSLSVGCSIATASLDELSCPPLEKMTPQTAPVTDLPISSLILSPLPRRHLRNRSKLLARCQSQPALQVDACKATTSRARVAADPIPSMACLSVSPARRRRRRSRYDQLSRCQSQPTLVAKTPRSIPTATRRQPRRLVRNRTAPTRMDNTNNGGEPCFNWVTFAATKRGKVQQTPRAVAAPRSKSASETNPSSSPRCFQPQVVDSIKEEEKTASRVTCTVVAPEKDDLDVFDWKEWAKTQSRRIGGSPDGSTVRRRYTTARRSKSKRNSDPTAALLIRQRRVKSERHLTSRRSSC